MAKCVPYHQRIKKLLENSLKGNQISNLWLNRQPSGSNNTDVNSIEVSDSANTIELKCSSGMIYVCAKIFAQNVDYFRKYDGIIYMHCINFQAHLVSIRLNVFITYDCSHHFRYSIIMTHASSQDFEIHHYYNVCLIVTFNVYHLTE